MEITLRPITDDERARYARVEARGFGETKVSDDALVLDAKVVELDRTIAAFDGDDLVGTAFSFPFDLTLPGGATLAAAGVSGVTVSATHRRRGILRQMMDRQLTDVADRGEPLAILNASEAAIYGRFGYGLAQLYQCWTLVPIRAAFRTPVRDDLVLRLVERNDAKPLVAPIYDTWRRSQPGALSQSDGWWDNVLASEASWRGGGKVFVVVCEPGADHDGGYAIYSIDNEHPAQEWTLDVRELVATHPDVEARLWRYVLDVDLVGTVTAQARPLDDPLRWRLTDPRQVQTTAVRDYLYVRILDVPAALAARRYAVADEVVLDVTDPFRPDLAGRFCLAGGPDDTRCEPTDADADVTLDIADLGSLLLGGVAARDLARSGRLGAADPAVVDRLGALFSWPVAPFCTTRF